MLQSCISYLSYIKPQLVLLYRFIRPRCISYLSYIKPQLFCNDKFIFHVVYLIFPTSNRNLLCFFSITDFVVYLIFPTSNRNLAWMYNCVVPLYILSFLHQTATKWLSLLRNVSCISYLSYIKPQLEIVLTYRLDVVYLIFPTSNRNIGSEGVGKSTLYILSFLHQTATLWAYYN